MRQSHLSIDGNAGERVIESLRTNILDLGSNTLDFAFGHVYSRPGLGLKPRGVSTAAAQTALDNVAPQLKTHIHLALNAGCSLEDVIEIIFQMAVYAGFPATLNAAFQLRKFFRGVGLLGQTLM